MTGMRPAADPATGPGEPGPSAVGAGPPVTISRWSRTASGFTGVAAVAVVVLAAVPYFAGGPAEAPLITLLTFVAWSASGTCWPASPASPRSARTSTSASARTGST